MSSSHEIRANGLWRNDDTADVGLWCETCKDWLYLVDERDPTIEEINAAVVGHRQRK